jgi:leucyl-tRNA synthetase
MSSEAGASDAALATSDVPPFRYTAALADQIELAWQDRWEREGTFNVPNPIGPLSQGFDAVAGRQHLFVMDMFPYPSGEGLHVGHPLGFIGTDVFARYQRMRGDNVLHTMGFDAFGLPAEQYAVQTGQHPDDLLPHRRVQTTVAADGSRARPASRVRDHRQGLLPLDTMDLSADLQQLL